jgi:hypothetical protein
MNKKMMYALVSVVVIIVAAVAVAGAYVLMNSGGGGKTVKVADATSLQYDVDVTYQGTTSLSKFAGKNLGASDIILRIDLSGGGQANYTNIINGADQTAWRSTNGNWTDVSTTYNTIWDIGCGKQWTNNVNALANWSGTGDYTYTDSVGTSYRIYNVVINPTLDNSLFQHPT